MSELCGYHQTRFTFDKRRETLWRALIKFYFQRLIREDDCVLELGAGYGHFINNVNARRRIAVDLFPDLPAFLQPGVEGHVGNITDLSFLEDGSVDFVFASNIFEHLTQVELSKVLDHVKPKLSARGQICVLQPNYYYAFREYFDDYTHITVYSHVSLCDFLQKNGYHIVKCEPRFTPLTVKRGATVSPALIWLYLKSPVKPFGKQMLVIARRN